MYCWASYQLHHLTCETFCVSYFLKVAHCIFLSFDGSHVFANHHCTSAPSQFILSALPIHSECDKVKLAEAGAKGEMNEYLMNEKEFHAECHLPASLDLTARRSRAGRRPFSERHQM